MNREREIGAKEQTQNGSVREVLRTKPVSWFMNLIVESDALLRGDSVLVTANDVSERGVELYLEGVEKALENKILKAVAFMCFGAFYDVFDGARARSTGGGLPSSLAVRITRQERQSFSSPDGQLTDVLCDREREIKACLLCSQHYFEKTRDETGYNAFVNTALSCSLSSVARAFVEANGSSVSELGKGTSLPRIKNISLMAIQLGRGEIEEARKLAQQIYDSNIETGKFRLKEENITPLNREAEDFTRVVEEGQKRYSVLVDFMNEFIVNESLSRFCPEGWLAWAQDKGINFPENLELTGND